jgi:hypothetical protein
MHYFEVRRFQSPYLKLTEAVTPLSAVWAFLCGPVYYWRKRAPIEALVFAVALGALLLLDPGSAFTGVSDDTDIGAMLWTAFALAAPILLPACYRRKGWIEVGRTRR